MFPAVQFTSNIWLLFLIGGLFLNILGFIYIAVALYSVAVLFTLVTLPVEFDASTRAKAAAERPRPRPGHRERGRQERPLGCGLDVCRRCPGGGRDAPLLPLAALEPIARAEPVTVTCG